jgi:hypothetical protein
MISYKCYMMIPYIMMMSNTEKCDIICCFHNVAYLRPVYRSSEMISTAATGRLISPHTKVINQAVDP